MSFQSVALGQKPDAADDHVLLTTIDAARMLEVTDRGVRWLAHTKQLACERTLSGQLLFRKGVVRTLGDRRADDRVRTRSARLAAVRRQMARADGEPRQLPLFKARLRIVGGGHVAGERALPDPEAKRRRVGEKVVGVR
jgi:hypothetical protein